jgi:ADP-ribosylglycohydrolase
VFCVAIARAVSSGDGPAEVYEFVRQWAVRADVHPDVRWWLADAADRPPDDYTAQMGWVRIALQNAFYRLLYSKDFASAVSNTVACGGDTDTNAAIVGALAGAVHGAAAVPFKWRDCVLTCRPVWGLTDVAKPRPSDFWPVDALILAERLLVLGRKASGRTSG